MSKSLGFSIGFKFSMYGELVDADLRHATSLGEGGRLQSSLSRLKLDVISCNSRIQ